MLFFLYCEFNIATNVFLGFDNVDLLSRNVINRLPFHFILVVRAT